MRPPVGSNWQDFYQNWYNASRFGVNRGSYFHNGDDLNLITMGDSDLGQPLYAVGDGEIVYYHQNSHPTTSYGKHMVLEVKTSVGWRWFHYAHCQSITAQRKQVKEGEMIGRVGKSGTKWAHLHFSCFKVDPKNLRRGIDTIAKTQDELIWWESPVEFLEDVPSSTEPMPETIEIEKKTFEELVTKSSKLDDLVNKGINEQTFKTLEGELKAAVKRADDIADEYGKFIREIVNKLKPSGVLPDFTDRHYALQLVEEIVTSESDMRRQLRKTEDKLSKKQEEWEQERKHLNDRIDDLEGKISEYAEELKEIRKQVKASEEKKQEINYLKKFVDKIKSLFRR